MSRRRNLAQENRNADDNSDNDEANDQIDGFHPLMVEDGYSESEFHQPFPFKTAFFVMTFLIVGTTCILCSFIMTFSNIDYGERTGALFICGILLFIPGVYFTSIMLRTYFQGIPMAEVLPQF